MFRFIKLLLIIYIGSLTIHECRAQMDSLVYGAGSHALNSEAKGELRATIEAMPFLRNNEYKSKLVKGYTLPGIWLDPTLSYQPLRNLKIDVGAHMLHFWGANKYPNFNYSQIASWNGENTQNGFHCVPIFRAQMQLATSLQVVLGTLYGKTNHGLIEPLYNDELNFSSDPETGIQVLLSTRPVQLDAWVNWESFIFKNDTRQESFSFGLSTRFKPSRRNARCQWYIPLQAVFQHRGGEINSESEDRSIKTWLNAATGVGIDIPLRSKFPASLNLEASAAYYSQQAGTLLPFSSGYGFYGKATARVWRCKLSVGYWYCKDFISIFGNPLFGAMSISTSGLTLQSPQTLTAHLEYAHELGKGFAWGVHADVFNQFATNYHTPETGYRIQKSTLNFAAGICLRVYPSFLIKKF